MILALVAFSLSLTQLLIEKGFISSQHKASVYLVSAILSGIPLMFQSLLLLGELSRAGRHGIKLVLYRAARLMAGNYGLTINMILKQYGQKKFGDYPEAQGWLWVLLLYAGHSCALLFSYLVFSDAFSGQYIARYVSLALWLGSADDDMVWIDCIKPAIDDNIFLKSHVKDVRHVNLTVDFRRLQLAEPDPQQKVEISNVHCRIIATGSQESPVSQLYYQEYNEECTEAAAREFCTLLETLNNDAFVLKARPPDGNDHLLSCEDLDTIVLSIIRDGKKVCAKRVYGMAYI